MRFSAAFALSCRAQSLGKLAEVALIDRDTGVSLSIHSYRGEYWVAGRPGARYAIEIRNNLGERVLAVTSVDGINVLSGSDAAWDQAGYVFGGGESYQISGWRKSSAEIAAFTFTAFAQFLRGAHRAAVQCRRHWSRAFSARGRR